MKAVVTTLFGLILFGGIYAQRACSSNEYQLNELRKDPSLTAKYASIEQFTQHYIHSSSAISGSSITGRVEGDGTPVIKIPVVVHILYHFPSEDISDATIQTQIAALNRDFRKQNADTSKIPSYFASRAADCRIEFELARSDSRGRSTSGIIHKYTPITKWEMDDKIKFSSEMGDDAWDA
ncbi:MAG: hypothetical protein JSU05_15140, partial [Bacteroidetes bacterium]|nr:hypothetical protein [Bacteroidota bacterium]